MLMTRIGFKQSRKSVKDYFLWRKERALPAVKKVNQLKRLKGKHVLDVGCGYGALTELLTEKGALVSATEIDKPKLAYATKMLGKNKNLTFKHVSNEILPFKDNSFDVVFLFDVIEHVPKPQKMMQEVIRVTKTDGLIYVEFTPFYSITGHHLYDYTKLPIHLFAPSRIKRMIYTKQVDSFNSQDYYWELYKSLNKLKVSHFQEMMKKTTKIEEKFIIKYPDKFEINLPILNLLGPFKDLFTMSYESIYQK